MSTFPLHLVAAVPNQSQRSPPDPKSGTQTHKQWPSQAKTCLDCVVCSTQPSLRLSTMPSIAVVKRQFVYDNYYADVSSLFCVLKE